MELFYDSGKRYDKNGKVIVKGVPYVNSEKRKLKLERKKKKEQRKLLKREGMKDE